MSRLKEEAQTPKTSKSRNLTVKEQDQKNLKDPMSAYASADAMDQPLGSAGKVHAEPLQDSMSSYASADALDTTRANKRSTEDPFQDAMSGYASADALTRKDGADISNKKTASQETARSKAS